MWNRKQFEDAAQKIGDEYTASGGTKNINDLALKVAQEGGLNPDGIRTVVRLANVAVFENMFSKAASDKAPDRMFDFVVGDAEQVIMQLGKDAKTATVKTAEYYHDRAMDYYGDFPTGLEKRASAVVHVGVERPAERPLPREEVRALFKQAEERMLAAKKEAEITWYTILEKAAQCVRTDVRTTDRVASLEKNAVAQYGDTVLAELRMLRKFNSQDAFSGLLGSQEKLAYVTEYEVSTPTAVEVPILLAVKEAADLRQKIHKIESSITWVKTNAEAL